MGLNIHDFHDKHISRFCILNFEWSRKIMDLSEINISHIVCAVIVANLTSSPVDLFWASVAIFLKVGYIVGLHARDM